MHKQAKTTHRFLCLGFTCLGRLPNASKYAKQIAERASTEPRRTTVLGQNTVLQGKSLPLN